MAPRWSRQAAVSHHDDLTAAPRVVDPYESDHLPRDGPLLASWHGPASRRAFAAASIALVVGGIGLLGFFAVSDILGPPERASDPAAGAAAQPDGGMAPVAPADPDLEGILNSTTPAPTPGP